MKFKVILALFSLCVSMTNLNAQTIVKLWEGTPAYDSGIKEKESSDSSYGWITNVTVAELWIYEAEASKATGHSVIICPGGGYGGLAFNHEGIAYAKWLNEQGLTAFVLKYRMPNGHKEIPLADAYRAMKYVRDNAEKLNIDINKIGVSGFSAGGHLAATMSTCVATDDQSLRPAFSILFYPVVTMQVATHGGSRNNLMGTNPTQSDLLKYSAEKQVDKNTPPAILLLSDDDESVQTDNSVDYYKALKKYNIPTTMYIFPTGGHGWGMKKDFEYHEQFLGLLASWLKKLK